MKLVSKTKVKNPKGLHTRPATAIVKLLQGCKSSVNFTHKRDTVNAKSILSLLLLAATRNTVITVSVEGEDAQDVMEKLLKAFDDCFGEPSK